MSAVIATLLLAIWGSTPPAAAQGACNGLGDHTAVLHEIYVRGDSIIVDGTRVARSTFSSYLHLLKRKKGAVIHLVWDAHSEQEAAAIANRIRAAGLTIAMNCPRIPF